MPEPDKVPEPVKVPDKVTVGTIGKPHGLDGAVVVHPETDNPDRFKPGASLDTDSGKALIVGRARRSEAILLVTFVGVTDRDAAEALRGLVLTISADDRRNLEDDEFWPEDLVGLEVRDPTGSLIGRVAGIDAEAPQPRLTIATDRGEFVVPLVNALVPEVNVGDGYLVIEPIDGLLEP